MKCQIHGGEFDPTKGEGCYQCVADRMGEEGNTDASIAAEIAKTNQSPEVKVVNFPEEEPEIGTVQFGIEIPEGSAVVVIDAGKAPNFSKHLEAAQRILKIASTREILNENDAKGANDDSIVMSELSKAITAERRLFTDPLNGYVKSINEAYKLITDPLTEADEITRKLLTAYKVAQQKKAAEVEALNREAMELARRQAEANQGEITVDLKPVPVPFAPKLTRTASGKSGLVDNWKYEVTDYGLLPREYMMPDDAILKAIAKKYHDGKQVSGIRFYNEPDLRVSR